MHEVGAAEDNSSHLKGKSKDGTLELSTSRVSSLPFFHEQGSSKSFFGYFICKHLLCFEVTDNGLLQINKTWSIAISSELDFVLRAISAVHGLR